ncbi:MAG TPA: efflux RND transporter periplasmic adaptor subunit [Micropepsaceae bacterium]|nr:efflux RND transporter periplasmic adaptor subunit [Micropepsaceae bacterium]
MNVPPSRQIAQSIPGIAQKAKPRNWLIGGGALILALGAFWYVTRADNAPTGGQRPSAAAPVRVAEVIRRDMSVVRRTPGTVIANTTVQVTARVQGVLDAANFKEGQFVKKGDLLFRIDPRPFEAALAQARAMLVRDQAQLKNADRDRLLYEHLNQIGAVSTQQRDTSVSSVEVLNATLAADEAAINIAQLNLGYTEIRSPVDGKTGPMLVQPGNMIATNSTTPLVTIAQIQPIKISFNLPQADLQLILARQRTNGLTAIVDSNDAAGKPLSAPIDFTSNAVNNQSGTIELRATFDNKDLSFLPGQLVNVTVELNKIPDALVVPSDAVNDGPDGSYVYVVAGGKAVQHTVRIVFDDSKNIAVEGDVKPGDSVIVEGQLRVDPNGAVNVLPSKNGTQARPNISTEAFQEQNRRVGNAAGP